MGWMDKYYAMMPNYQQTYAQQGDIWSKALQTLAQLGGQYVEQAKDDRMRAEASNPNFESTARRMVSPERYAEINGDGSAGVINNSPTPLGFLPGNKNYETVVGGAGPSIGMWRESKTMANPATGAPISKWESIQTPAPEARMMTSQDPSPTFVPGNRVQMEPAKYSEEKVFDSGKFTSWITDQTNKYKQAAAKGFLETILMQKPDYRVIPEGSSAIDENMFSKTYGKTIQGNKREDQRSWSRRDKIDPKTNQIATRQINGDTYFVEEEYDRNDPSAPAREVGLRKVDNAEKLSLYTPGTPESIKSWAEAIAEYRVPIDKVPRQDKTLAWAMAQKLNPSLDAVSYETKRKTALEYTATGRAGAKLQNINTGIRHAGEAISAISNLKNDKTQITTKLKNWIATTFGGDRAKNLSTFETISSALAGEFASLFKGGNASATDEEIDTQLNNLKSSNTPEQLFATLKTLIILGKDRIKGYENSYRRDVGGSKTFYDDDVVGILNGLGLEGNRPPTVSASPATKRTKKLEEMTDAELEAYEKSLTGGK